MNAISFVCYKCDKPPSRLVYTQCAERDSIHVKAYCHGEWDEVYVAHLALLGDPNVVLFVSKEDADEAEES